MRIPQKLLIKVVSSVIRHLSSVVCRLLSLAGRGRMVGGKSPTYYQQFVEIPIHNITFYKYLQQFININISKTALIQHFKKKTKHL
jgi:hypothetical protein